MGTGALGTVANGECVRCLNRVLPAVLLSPPKKTSMLAAKPVFSGHESFQCRALWLKKGVDFVEKNGSFSAENAVVELGVGKNMVGSIRFWLRAFGLVDAENKPTRFADELLSDDGLDPFLEDDLTLWLLHHRLVKTGHAGAYSLIFNELRRQQIEFSEAHFTRLVEEKAQTGWSFQFNVNTAKADFEVFCKLYLAAASSDREDVLTGLLTELRLLAPVHRADKKATFQIVDTERDELPDIALLFALLDDERIGLSVNFEAIAAGPDSPGAIFAINRTGLLQKIERLAERFDFLVFSENAGVRELQFREKPDPFEILEQHYKNA